MNKEEFVKKLKDINIICTDDILNKLDIYYKFLKEYNEHTNLTRIIDEEDVYLKHFYDSIVISKYFDFNSINTLIDVGTGAGFPGVVLKIFYPHINLTLLDSNNKKILFLNELVDKLELNNVNIIHERSEIYAKNNLDKYDLVIARAVKNLKELSELCLPLVKVNEYFISMKGIEEEYNHAKDIINILNGQLENKYDYSIDDDNKRTLYIFKKINKTPKGYPREYNKIKNK